MVSALTQQTAKGPVDCVTGKALYTLSEDWLLWQAQDFSSLVQTHTDAPILASQGMNTLEQIILVHTKDPFMCDDSLTLHKWKNYQIMYTEWQW